MNILANDGHIHNGQLITNERSFSDQELSEQIDPVLNNDDLNKDGYISYPEFLTAQKKVIVDIS